MNFRARLTLAFLAIAALPLVILGYGVRREMTSRLETEAMRRVETVSAAVSMRVTSTIEADRERLSSLAADLANDNRFRIGLAQPDSPERRWLIDWANDAMLLAGFAVLQLQDSTGRILSSGHFRNDFDRVAPDIPAATSSTLARAAIVDARTPAGPVRALVASVDFSARGESFTLTGGPAFDSVRVAQFSSDASVSAIMTTDSLQPPGEAVVVTALPFVDETRAHTGLAAVYLLADSGPLRELRRGVTRWLLVALGATLLVAVVLATLLGRLVSAPIADLARRTERLDLDKLDQKFATGRDDEVGTLERKLDELTRRLRTSVSRLREAERAAATGDLARQINHDIKNGLAPIRNVLRHLGQVAEREPETLPAVYADRKETLESSVEYLDQLARNYARLSPSLGGGRTDPRPVVMDIARGVNGATVDLRIADELPRIKADAVVLHRILDNVVSNAVDALEGKAGTITIAAHPIGMNSERRVRFSVTDTGRGMTRQELDRAFSDFYTTKPSGTGLGLSVVRRLLTDVGGSVRAETEPGKGSTFMIDIPAADH